MSEQIVYPTSFQACDIVIYKRDTRQLLLGQKWADKTRTKPKTERRFIGGFVDPADPSLEYAAMREKGEEAGINLEVTQPVYVGSFRVDDPRYRNSIHKIMSAVFYCEYMFGIPKAGDDIAAVEWIDIDEFRLNYDAKGYLAPEHIPLVQMLIKKAYL
jgi:bifunctional NMN adenylyltransferase/nudix hydrolase